MKYHIFHYLGNLYGKEIGSKQHGGILFCCCKVKKQCQHQNQMSSD